MEKWKNFTVYSKNKLTSTEKSHLFAMPSNGEYKDYKFWHNAKLCHETKNPKFMSLGYTDETEFKLIKSEKQGDKYVVVDTITLKGDQMKEAFASCNKPYEKKAPKVEEPKLDEPELDPEFEEPDFGIEPDDLPFM